LISLIKSDDLTSQEERLERVKRDCIGKYEHPEHLYILAYIIQVRDAYIA